MNPNIRKYRLVLGDELLNEFRPDLIKRFIREWIEASGALNVASSVIRADRIARDRCVEYTIAFDSSAWTGIGFKGFNTKNRNFS
jgi:hypothetical protein